MEQRVAVPEDELEFSFSRSGGPGGQHVNTSATKVELRFDVDASAALDDRQKALVRRRLGSRLTRSGVLVLHADEYRSQARNRAAAVERLHELLDGAVQVRTPRRPTQPTRGSTERRLADKRSRGETKRQRQLPAGDD